MEIKIEKAKVLKEKPDFSKLGFGKYFTDHMFVMEYTEGKGWENARGCKIEFQCATEYGIEVVAMYSK